MASVNDTVGSVAPSPYSVVKRVCKPPGGDCHDIFTCDGDDYGERIIQGGEQPHHRVTKPPGGDCSDIFATGPVATPPSTPRKKNHMSSNIFGPAEPPQSVPRKQVENTSFTKLFGEMAVSNGTESTTKEGQNGTQNGTNGSVSPVLNGHSGSKTIVGDAHDSASSSGNSSGSATPSGSNTPPNGSVNGDPEPRTNGHAGTNGVAPPVIGTPKKARIPPGGHATKLW